MMLNCIIVDDEPFARKLLQGYCNRLPDLNVTGNYASGIEAMSALQEKPPDLLFLDIQMPGLNGLDLLRTLPSAPYIIFTTAYSEYAVQGFEWDAVDYLLKPFDFPRFLKAINRVRNRQLPAISQEKSGADTYLFVKEGRDLVKLKIDDILFIKGQKDYVQFHCLSNHRTLSLMNLKDLEQKLTAYQFLRIHQSYIINTTHMTRCSLETVQIGEQTLPVSQSYRLQLKAYLKDLQ
jgi:DNA-binding LytR/AlgR family response regulator